MNEWTGERFVLGAGGAEVHHEHVHRYLVAREIAGGCAVLDLGCGSGVGSAILGEVAESVMAIDVDSDVITAAGRDYGARVSFAVGSAYDIPLPDRSVDRVVCFEVIEHLREPDRAITEVARVLRPDGLFVVSTPMRSEYNKTLLKPNPFHVSEMEHDEFVSLVEREFHIRRCLRQRSVVASVIWDAEEPEQELTFDSPSLERLSAVYEILIAGCQETEFSVSASAFVDLGVQEPNEPETVSQLRVARIQLAEWEDTVNRVAAALRNADARVSELERQIEGENKSPDSGR